MFTLIPLTIWRTGLRGAALLYLLLAVSGAQASQYIAYSLKTAQQRVEKAGPDWRTKDPNLFNLAGINHVDGFVYDKAYDDLILVGRLEEGRAPLTLDDLVVALRARFRYNQWPLVSIDPTRDTKKTEMQHVRFEGGIEETAFGQALYDADYRLKQMAMGLKGPGIPEVTSVWDRQVRRIANVATNREINSRFWFFPINPVVQVRKGVCILKGLSVGVFTEVLSAKVNGNPVEDVKTFKDAENDAFANDVSASFEKLCSVQPSFNRLRGLQELVGVSKALEELEEKPDFAWWLEKYTVERVETPTQTKVLLREYKGDRGRYEVSGGVHLTALALRINAGDVEALRDAVMKLRPNPGSLDWGFIAAKWIIPLGPGQIPIDDVTPLIQQAMFLQTMKRYGDVITLCNKIIEVNADNAEAYRLRAWANHERKDFVQSIADATQAIAIKPLAANYVLRAMGYWSKGLPADGVNLDVSVAEDQKAEIFNEVVRLKPELSGSSYDKEDNSRAISDLTDAIRLNPNLSFAYLLRSMVYIRIGKLELAMADASKYGSLEGKPKPIEQSEGKPK